MLLPTTYEFVIRGRVSARSLRPFLDDFTFDHTSPGVTRLVGQVADPSHLYGLLAHLAAISAEVVSLTPFPPRLTTPTRATTHTEESTP